MRNSDGWKPGKFVYRKGRLRASLDPGEVSPGSRLMADLIAACYQRALPEHVNGGLLDLGCGRVPLYGAYRHLVTEIVCADWQNSLHGSAHMDFSCDLTLPLPLRDGQFQTVILADVLEHVPEPGMLVKEIHRVLSPGGKLILSVPFCYRLHEKPYDFYRYTEFALRRFALAAGFSVVALESFGGAPEVIADILSKRVVRVPILGSPMAGLIQRVAYMLAGVRSSAGAPGGTGDFPLGYFMVAEKKCPSISGTSPGPCP